MRNISTVRRTARDLEVGMAWGDAERRVMFTCSYRSFICHCFTEARTGR